jgi:hypothetical protein
MTPTAAGFAWTGITSISTRGSNLFGFFQAKRYRSKRATKTVTTQWKKDTKKWVSGAKSSFHDEGTYFAISSSSSISIIYSPGNGWGARLWRKFKSGCGVQFSGAA